MTHDEACALLRMNAAALKHGTINLDQWQQEVERVLVTAYPDAKASSRAPLDTTVQARSHLRSGTRQPTRSGVAA